MVGTQNIISSRGEPLTMLTLAMVKCEPRVLRPAPMPLPALFEASRVPRVGALSAGASASGPEPGRRLAVAQAPGPPSMGDETTAVLDAERRSATRTGVTALLFRSARAGVIPGPSEGTVGLPASGPEEVSLMLLPGESSWGCQRKGARAGWQYRQPMGAF